MNLRISVFRKHAKRYPNTSVEAIRSNITFARQKGFAFSDGQDMKVVRAVGVPILNNDGVPIGALSVGGISERIPTKRVKVLADVLNVQRDRIERRLNASGLPASPDLPVGIKRY